MTFYGGNSIMSARGPHSYACWRSLSCWSSNCRNCTWRRP